MKFIISFYIFIIFICVYAENCTTVTTKDDCLILSCDCYWDNKINICTAECAIGHSCDRNMCPDMIVLMDIFRWVVIVGFFICLISSICCYILGCSIQLYYNNNNQHSGYIPI